MIDIRPATRSFVCRSSPIRLPVRTRGEIGRIRGRSGTPRARLWSRQRAVRAQINSISATDGPHGPRRIDQAEVKNPNRCTADFVQPEF